MSLELFRESVRVNRMMGEDYAQSVVENDIIVPDIKPDVSKILVMDGEAFIENHQVMQEKVVINGSIHYKLLYISDDTNPEIKGINASLRFNQGFEIASARQGMKCKVKCSIEHIDYELLNGRKINVKTILKLTCKVMEQREQSFIYDLSGIEDLQLLKDTITLNSFIGANAENCNVREALEVPAGKPSMRELLRNDIKITGKDYKLTDDKVMAKGEIHVSTLYVGDDAEGSLQFMEHAVPFAQLIDLQGVGDNATCELDFKVENCEFEAAEDGDGESRVLNVNISIQIDAEAYEKKSVDVVSDAFSPKTGLNLEKESFSVEDLQEGSKSQMALKDNILLDDGEPEITEVVNVLSKPVLSEIKIENEKVILEGAVDNSVLYLSGIPDQPVSCKKQSVPFRQAIEIRNIKDDMTCDIGLDIDHCSYSLVSANEVEVRLVVSIFARVANPAVIPLVVRVAEYPLSEALKKSQPSITVYFSQPGDTVWKVAKRYYTTIENMKRYNNLGDEDNILPGKQILIPKELS